MKLDTYTENNPGQSDLAWRVEHLSPIAAPFPMPQSESLPIIEA